MVSSLVPVCRYCGTPLMQMREHDTYGKIKMVDRVTGEHHKCGKTWLGINSALEHPYKAGMYHVRWSDALVLLGMLKRGPVMQSDLKVFGNPSSTLHTLRHYILGKSGLNVVGHWCCATDPKYLHARERVYQLEREL